MGWAALTNGLDDHILLYFLLISEFRNFESIWAVTVQALRSVDLQADFQKIFDTTRMNVIFSVDLARASHSAFPEQS